MSQPQLEPAAEKFLLIDSTNSITSWALMAAVASRSRRVLGCKELRQLQSTGIAQRLVGSRLTPFKTLFASAFRSTATRLVVAHTSCWLTGP